MIARTHRVARGVYEVIGTSDANGRPYRVARLLGQWWLQDSRGRPISTHFTRIDAINSIKEPA